MTESVTFESRGFKVICRQEDGEAKGWHYVRRKPGIAILAVADDGKILFVKQRRPAIGQELLEIPAGGVEGDGSLEHEAKRELEEETGYVARRIELITEIYGSPGYFSEKTYIFFADDLLPGTQYLTDNETRNELRLVRMRYSDAVREIQLGRITDAKTVVAVLLYARQVESRRHEATHRTVIIHEKRSRLWSKSKHPENLTKTFMGKLLAALKLTRLHQ
jgi:ADP-ribose pyrophosphatase